MHDGDAEALMEVIVAMGALAPNPALAQPFFEAYDAIFGWTFIEEELRVDGTRDRRDDAPLQPAAGPDGFDSLALPAEHFVMMRSAMLLTGLLGMLEASNNWSAIAREWLFDDPAVTELGLLEAEFLAGGGPAVSARADRRGPATARLKLRGEMIRGKRTEEPRALTSGTAERLAAIVGAAEQAAAKVIDDAEEQARRQLLDAGAHADPDRRRTPASARRRARPACRTAPRAPSEAG